MSHLFVITGATAVGEDTIITGLQKRRALSKIINTTTRPMRPTESEGLPYYFISRATFEENITKNRMIEYASGTGGEYYGVTKKEFERHLDQSIPVIWKVDFKGALAARKLFPDCTIIHITVTSPDVISKRLRGRDKGATKEYIAERLAYAKNWDNYPDLYDFTVVNENGKLQASIDQVDHIISTRLGA